MQVRLLTEADAAAYRQIRLRGLREDPAAFGSSYEEEVERPLEFTAEWLRAKQLGPDSFALGAFDEREELLGVLSFTRVPRLKEQHKAMIHGVYVIAEARGRGLGRSLVAETLARARQSPGLTQVQLSVVTCQTAARALYAAFGFVPYGLERQALTLDGEFLDEEHLVLFLRERPH
jgi:RimJ/RimL family protein N-acetyltransferase